MESVGPIHGFLEEDFPGLAYLDEGVLSVVYQGRGRENPGEEVAIKAARAETLFIHCRDEEAKRRGVQFRADCFKVELAYLLYMQREGVSYPVRVGVPEERAWQGVGQGIPYIVLELLPLEKQLPEILSRAGEPGGLPLPLWEVLELARQWFDFLAWLHRRGLNYPDQKLAHSFWFSDWFAADPAEKRLRVIDFHPCRPWEGWVEHGPPGEGALPQEGVSEDIRKFAECILYPLLTDQAAGGGRVGPERSADAEPSPFFATAIVSESGKR